jgi:hypothetical protein
VVEAVEYYHAGFDHYFMTAFPAEQAVLDTGTIAGWVRTGRSFSVNDASGTAVFRFFSTTFDPKSSHFYTSNASEGNGLKANPNWQYEGNAFYVGVPSATGACSTGSKVYRLYNNGQGGAPNHRYTTDTTVRSQMLARGWIPEGQGAEGVAFCTAQVTSVAFTKTNQLVGGTWVITYKYGMTNYTDTARFTTIQPTASATVPYMAYGKNKWNRDAYGGWGASTSALMVLSELTPTSKDVYVFDFTGANSMSGCYYFDYGQPNPFGVPCTPLAGVRSAAVVTLAEELSDPTRGKLDYVTTQKSTVAEPELESALRELRAVTNLR